MFNIKDLENIPPRILLAITLASNFIIFLPEEIIQMLYMINFKERYGFIIGPVFLLSSSILLCMVIFYLTKKYKFCMMITSSKNKVETY